MQFPKYSQQTKNKASKPLSEMVPNQVTCLSQIKIILACEKIFDIRLNARDINTLENVGAMLDHLHGLNV